MLAKRLTEIMDILGREGSVSVSDLSKRCGVTQKTIRLDLDKLEELNVVSRVHGGAVLMNNNSDIYPVLSRKQKHTSEKTAIARTALELIEDGDVIFLDAGTTILELAKQLNKNVIVITNDAKVAAELLERDSVTLYCTGGLLQRTNGSFIYTGTEALHAIASYHTGKCFMACSALNFNYGAMVFSGDEARIKEEIVKASEKVICLTDYSKFHKTALRSYMPLDRVDVCVTDAQISDEDVAALNARGVEVKIASSK